MIESDASGALFVKIIDYGVAKVLAAETDPDRANASRVHWHAGFCQSGTIC